MSEIIFGAVIGGSATIAATVGAVLLKHRLEKPKTHQVSCSKPSRDLRKLLCGTWVGVGWDNPEGAGKPDFDFVWYLLFDEVTFKLKGQSTIMYPGENPEAFDLVDGFVCGNQCLLIYKALEEGAIRFGSVIIDFGMKPDTLKGTFQGRSYRHPGEVVNGRVELKKSCPMMCRKIKVRRRVQK